MGESMSESPSIEALRRALWKLQTERLGAIAAAASHSKWGSDEGARRCDAKAEAFEVAESIIKDAIKVVGVIRAHADAEKAEAVREAYERAAQVVLKFGDQSISEQVARIRALADEVKP